MSNITRLSLIPVCVAGLLMAASAHAARSEDSVLAKEGVFCKALADGEDVDARETHSCVFSPGRFGRHDFSSRNARAGHVVSVLGPDCDEIEILADEEHVREGQEQPKYRRVSVSCTVD